MSNLFALCRAAGALRVKHVRITQAVQEKIAAIFQTQAAAFLDGVHDEIEFGGDWKPDADEVLVMDLPEEAAVITAALANPLELPTLDAQNFMGERMKALFTSVQDGQNARVFVQLFNAQQILARRFSLMLDGDTFKELTEPAFTLDNYIVAIIENGKLKFKSFFNMKKIFELKQFYEEATDQEVEAFCGHDSLQVADLAAFKATADQTIRKMIHAVGKTNVLENYAVEDIVVKANSLGLNLQAENGKIIVPGDRKSIKQLLRFLDDGIYEASLTAKRYVTNSKRPFA